MLALLFVLLFADQAVAESFEVRLVKWVQKNMADGFKQGQFSSAALSVVRSEEEILSITFGLSDLPARTIAHPYQTRFRVSSITKVFSAVAIAQLLQEGKIRSLDEPVNTYLKRFRVPDNRNDPVTIHHLLTHSAGFDYSSFGLYSNSAEVNDVSALLPQQLMPIFVRPVDQWAVYSNYGGALLGVLVEDISGVSMEAFLRKRLFIPLGMKHTQLVRRGRSTTLAVPYQVQSPHYYAPLVLEDFSNLMSLSMGIESTAHDMGRFLRFLLSGKDIWGNQLLSWEMLDLMRHRRFSNHPHASGFGMILDIVRQTPDLNLFMHNGATRGFSSHLLFVPDYDLGVFVSVVGAPAPTLSDGPIAHFQSAPRLMASFVRELITPYEFPEPGRALGNPGRLSGHYLSEKRATASPEAVFSLINPPMYREVAAVEGNYVSNGRSAREIAANVFHFGGRYAYREMFGWQGGQFYMAIYGSMVLVPVAWAQLPHNLRWILGLALMAVATAPLTITLNRGRGHDLAHCILALTMTLLIGTLLIWLFGPRQGLSALQLDYQRGALAGLKILLGLCHFLLLAIVVWILTAHKLRGLAANLHGLAVSCAGVVVALGFWRLNIIGEGSRWLF